MSNNQETIRLLIEDPSGNRFECDVAVDHAVGTIAADFFESRDWPTTDNRGKRQRAVADLVDPANPNRFKRLTGGHTVDQAGLFDGALLRVFPESIAGRVDERERVRALVADHQDMLELVGWNPHIKFEANVEHAPTHYTITFDYPSFQGLSDDGHTPIITTNHRLEITLGADYPRRAPRVRWRTPIFHPNIDQRSGGVCLGVLTYRYLPGLGLARLVLMLSEMVQYRNFDMISSLNRVAADWAKDSEHWEHIYEIGGSPLQGPVLDWFKELEEIQMGGKRTRLKFQKVTTGSDS